MCYAGGSKKVIAFKNYRVVNHLNTFRSLQLACLWKKETLTILIIINELEY